MILLNSFVSAIGPFPPKEGHKARGTLYYYKSEITNVFAFFLLFFRFPEKNLGTFSYVMSSIL